MGGEMWKIVTAEDDRAAFTLRLAFALHSAGLSQITNTELARDFNARSNMKPLTVHAVRKWKVGESIPTQARLLVLADWLEVSPEWLRFGDETRQTSTSTADLPGMVNPSLISDIGRLDSTDRGLVRELVNVLLHKVKN
jgi:transcriptional regulator with XRE-family HTH domain